MADENDASVKTAQAASPKAMDELVVEQDDPVLFEGKRNAWHNWVHFDGVDNDLSCTLPILLGPRLTKKITKTTSKYSTVKVA